MPEHVPLCHLSALNPPPGQWPMAVLKAYLDDSGDERDRRQHHAIAIAGYVAPVEAWESFERNWQAMLQKHGIWWLHMKEFGPSVKQFSGWKGDEERRASLLRDACACIKGAELDGIGAVVRLPDLERFNSETGEKLEPVPLALYLCMNTLYMKHPNDWMEVVVDRFDHCRSRVGRARQYAESHHGDDVGHTMEIACLENLSARQIKPLQAADLAAYEVLKFERSRTVNGDHPPAMRLEFESLLSAAPLSGPVADYRFLCDLHAARRGVWRSPTKGK